MVLKESELILNDKGNVYHLDVCGDNIADTVILVGDQNRVAEISKRFDNIEFQTSHREFVTHTGNYSGRRITVTSTGIGTDNIDIVLNELDAAVNINPKTRQVNSKHRKLSLIRLGTCGSLQGDIGVNELVASSFGLGFDGLLNFYEGGEFINEKELCDAFEKHVGWLPKLPSTYCIKSSDELISKLDGTFYKGITATAPGFYGPQGRQIKLRAAIPDLNEKLTDFKFNGSRICNFEMETSALYGLGKLLNHDTLTICVVIANRIKMAFTKDYNYSVDKLITKSLEAICR